GFVQHRGAGQVQSGQIGDHRLEVEQGFQAALGDLGLVRGVGGVPGRVLQHVAGDDGGCVGAVVPLPDHAGANGVLLGQGAQFGEHSGLVHGGWQRGLGDIADVLGHRACHEFFGAAHAEAFQHGLGGLGGVSDVPGGEGGGSVGHFSACQFPVRFWYSSAPSRPLGASLVATVNSQPWPYGSELTSSGLSTTASLWPVTSPVTGAYRSLTDFVDSISPQVSPAVMVLPISGRSTNTTSPRASAA